MAMRRISAFNRFFSSIPDCPDRLNAVAEDRESEVYGDFRQTARRISFQFAKAMNCTVILPVNAFIDARKIEAPLMAV